MITLGLYLVDCRPILWKCQGNKTKTEKYYELDKQQTNTKYYAGLYTMYFIYVNLKTVMLKKSGLL